MSETWARYSKCERFSSECIVLEVILLKNETQNSITNLKEPFKNLRVLYKCRFLNVAQNNTLMCPE